MDTKINKKQEIEKNLPQKTLSITHYWTEYMLLTVISQCTGEATTPPENQEVFLFLTPDSTPKNKFTSKISGMIAASIIQKNKDKDSSDNLIN